MTNIEVQKLAFECAQAALRGYFQDQEGFKDMKQEAGRRRSVANVKAILEKLFPEAIGSPEIH